MKRFLAFVLAVCLCLLGACSTEPTAPSTTQHEETPSTSVVIQFTETDATTTVTQKHTVTTISTSSVTTAATTSREMTTKVTATTSKTTVTTTVATKPKPQPLWVLSVGHSLSNDAHLYLSRLAEHEGREIYTFNLFYPSCSLKKHYEFWQSNEKAYYPVTNGKVDFNTKVSLTDTLNSRKWDVITLQESPTAACSADNMLNYGKKLRMIVMSKQPQAKLYVHQTWALADDSQYHSDSTGRSMAAMWAKVEPNYTALSKELGAPLIPSGLAMMELQSAYNLRNKGESVHRDGLHADSAWGSYLLALVWYRTLTGEKPSNTFDVFTVPYEEDTTVRKLVYDCAMGAVDTYA